MFLDKVRIYIQAGNGGNGCLSFRREKYIPWGGPNGGNGGPGGDVVLVADRNLTTLLDLTYRPHFKAMSGEPGRNWDKAGRSGESLQVRVPCGTVVCREGVPLADLTEHGQTLVVAKGGRGGRGNASFKTSRNIAPKIAEKGEPGESATLDLELKLIADVGLIGCPNAGKSTLLARISSAKPKIADYPFTTLSPNLGVARYKDRSFVVADIPGLIEGAHLGKGLGTEFLRHIERTRILVHIVDVSGFGEQAPYRNYRSVQKEISLYSKKLAKKPVIVAANKIDVTGADVQVQALKKKIKPKKLVLMSAVTGDGIDGLLVEIVRTLDKSQAEPGTETAPAQPRGEKFIFVDEFTVEREQEGFRVQGKKIERLFHMTNFDQEEGVRRFQNILKKMGVERVLQREGIQPGDPVFIGNMEFIYEDSGLS